VRFGSTLLPLKHIAGVDRPSPEGSIASKRGVKTTFRKRFDRSTLFGHKINRLLKSMGPFNAFATGRIVHQCL
jgi:hypothetical protein